MPFGAFSGSFRFIGEQYFWAVAVPRRMAGCYAVRHDHYSILAAAETASYKNIIRKQGNHLNPPNRNPNTE